MHIGERATLRARGEIGAQPLLLRRARGLRDVAVKGDDVPVAQVVAVVALRRIARGRTEVAEIAGGPGRAVLVVAGDRPGARLVPAPGGGVAVGAPVAGPARMPALARQKKRATGHNELASARGHRIAGGVHRTASADKRY